MKTANRIPLQLVAFAFTSFGSLFGLGLSGFGFWLVYLAMHEKKPEPIPDAFRTALAVGSVITAAFIWGTVVNGRSLVRMGVSKFYLVGGLGLAVMALLALIGSGAMHAQS